MSQSGTFSLTEDGIDFTVKFRHSAQIVNCRVIFSWTTIAKMEDPKREMNQIISKVVSRTVAMLEDSEL